MSDEFYLPLIPPIKTKRQKMELIQEIVRPKCADLLRANGFVSYKNEDLCWYRIIGGELLQAVYYFSTCSRVPLMLRSYFGCHPLFFEPPIPHPVATKRGFVPSRVMFDSIYWLLGCHLATNRSSDPVLHPALKLRENRLIYALPDDRDAAVLEKYVLPLLDEVRTIEMAYTMHKKENYLNFVPTDFIPFLLAEEAIYMGDEELYPLCIKIAKEIQSNMLICTQDPEMKIHADQMLEYFETEDRARYMQRMEERKQNTLKLLKKKLPHGTF